MSQKALRDELMTLLVAGQETSAILLGWACAFLAQHPGVQQRAAKEAQQVRSMHTISWASHCYSPGHKAVLQAELRVLIASCVATPQCLSTL